jgi:hypothetical protein
VVFLLYSVGLRFAFPALGGFRKSNGQLCGGLAKSVTEKNNEGKVWEGLIFAENHSI